MSVFKAGTTVCVLRLRAVLFLAFLMLTYFIIFFVLFLPFFAFALDIVCFILAFSCGYHAVSSVSVSAATRLAYYILGTWYCIYLVLYIYVS